MGFTFCSNREYSCSTHSTMPWIRLLNYFTVGFSLVTSNGTSYLTKSAWRLEERTRQVWKYTSIARGVSKWEKINEADWQEMASKPTHKKLVINKSNFPTIKATVCRQKTEYWSLRLSMKLQPDLNVFQSQSGFPLVFSCSQLAIKGIRNACCQFL